MSSDVNIAQFRFLERLLLLHGHWCYRRISMMVMTDQSSLVLKNTGLILWMNLCSRLMIVILAECRYATSSTRTLHSV